MATVGIIGGIGPASTLDYYKGVIQGYRECKRDTHYPKIVIDSVDMTEMLGYVAARDWDALVRFLLGELRKLANAGADFAALASNTPHIVFDRLSAQSPLPLVSIVDAVCDYTKKQGCETVIIFGTGFTMVNGLYTEPFARRGIKAVTPPEADQQIIHNIIFPKLEDGVVVPDDKAKILALANRMIREHNADGLVLGCTELPLMIQQDDLDVNVLNTTQIHIDAIVQTLCREPA